MKWALPVGLLLAGVSAYPIALMAREIAVGYYAYSRFRLESIPTISPGFSADALEADIGGHSVRLEDTSGRSDDRDARSTGPVRTLVDDQDYSSPSAVIIRPFYPDSNRYHGWVHLIRLVDTWSDHNYVAVAQRVNPQVQDKGRRQIPRTSETRYRVLLISEDGSVKEDTFSFSERGRPVTRKMLVTFVSPHPIGFYSEVLQVWPSIYYPVLYPWTTFAIGMLLVILGVVERVRARQARVNAGKR